MQDFFLEESNHQIAKTVNKAMVWIVLPKCCKSPNQIFVLEKGI